MPRKPKILPAERADFTYGDLVYWHLIQYGTRPNGDPSAAAGRPWQIKRVAGEIGIEEKTIRNWINDKNLPDESGPLAKVIFGDNPKWDTHRLELQQKCEAGWRAKNALRDAAAKSGNQPAPEAEAAPATEPEGADSEADDTGIEQTPEEAQQVEAYRNLVKQESAPPYSGAPHVTDRPLRSKPLAALVTAIALLLGAFVWHRLPSRPVESPAKPNTEAAKNDTPPVVKKPIELAAPNPLPAPRSVTPAAPVEPPKVTPAPPPQLTEEEKRAAEDKRIALAAVEARKAAYDAAARQATIDAARRDQEEQARDRAQRDRGADARNVAGAGFSLRENTSVAGQSIGYVKAETVADCAVACLRDNDCDAFSYYRDQPVSPLTKGRTCYRYKAPLTFNPHGSYTSGVRMPDGTRDFAAPSSAATVEPPVRLVQAEQATPRTDATDGVTQCQNGPVKVTGFRLTCDRTLSGGTTLGSTQLSYTVANINECAAKCRPVSRCVGFTFNAADTPGRHGCYIFGPTPEGREASGWVSGLR